MRSSSWLFVLSFILALFGQADAAPASPPQGKPAKGHAAPVTPQRVINAGELAMLIKSTIMALQHANQTGNYSVMRDLGTPVFRERFDQTRLAVIFSNLRSKGVSLSPVTMLPANLTRPPEFTQESQLHLVGNFQAPPLRIQFEMFFFEIDGIWRLDGLAVDAVPLHAAAIAPFVTTAEPARETSAKP
jgi:hypothetical protein